MCIGIGVSDGGQCPERPLDGDQVDDHLDGLGRPLVGIRPPGDLVEIVADAGDLPGALALDLGRRGRPRPVRAIARRISPDRGTPAAAALARQSANSVGETRTATMTVRRLAIGKRRHGGKGGDAPARELHRSAGLLGFEGAESLASPCV